MQFFFNSVRIESWFAPGLRPRIATPAYSCSAASFSS